jgi:hypothetical protein
MCATMSKLRSISFRAAPRVEGLKEVILEYACVLSRLLIFRPHQLWRCALGPSQSCVFSTMCGFSIYHFGQTMKLTIALSKSVTMGSMFWGESFSFETEAECDGIDAGVGWLALDDDEDSILIQSGCVSCGSNSERLELCSTAALSWSRVEAWRRLSSLATRSLRPSLVSRAAAWRSSRLCSVHLFPFAAHLSHVAESPEKMHRTFPFLHS